MLSGWMRMEIAREAATASDEAPIICLFSDFSERGGESGSYVYRGAVPGLTLDQYEFPALLCRVMLMPRRRKHTENLQQGELHEKV